MINALVSGSAARAVFIQGPKVQYIDAENPAVFKQTTLSAIPRLFEGAHDIVRMKIRKYTECFDVLLDAYRKDRALRMLQIVLEDDDLEDFEEATGLLEKMLADGKVADHVRNVAHAVPYPNFPRIGPSKFEQAPLTQKLYADLQGHQSAILSVREAFDGMKFSSEDLKCAYEKNAIAAGIFARMVDLATGQATTSDVTFECIRAFGSLPDVREISTRWVTRVGGKADRKLPKLKLSEPEAEDDGFLLDDDTRFIADRRAQFEAVSAQIKSIVERLDSRDVDVARRYADQLVDWQLQNSSSEYAVKSLSNLATEARHRKLHDIELEWGERARDVRPGDAWARALLGDTYLSMYRLNDAEEEFKAASSFGEEAYGRIGLARVAKQSGDLDRALTLFTEAKRHSNHSDYTIAAWFGYCTTLREMWKPEETLQAFERAKLEFPEEITFHVGYAKSLEYLGRLDDAKAAFIAAKVQWPGDPTGYCGEAEIYKHAGKFGAAERLYRHAVSVFPHSVDAIIGLADLYRKSGALTEALELYVKAVADFPYEPLVHAGAADTYLDVRDYPRALEIYEDAVDTFALNPVVRNGRANAYKRAGLFERSLQLYDQNVRDFPYNLPALSGRASLLKLLGKYDEALVAYDDVLSRQPRYTAAKAAKASALIAQGRFEEAEPLLAFGGLHTRNEWLTYHLRGMLHLRRGNILAARAIFENGASKVPFHRLRKQFQASLGCCELKSNAVDHIPEYLKGSDEPVHVLLRGIYFAFAGSFEKAAEEVKIASEPMSPRLEEIRNSLGTLVRSRHASDTDRAWLTSATEEAVLQLAA